MSKWFPDMETEEGVSDGSKAGSFGAFAFAAMIIIGMLFVIFGAGLPGYPIGSADQKIGFLAGMIVELLVIIVAAFRFREGKGLFIGSIALILFLIETFSKLTSGNFHFGWTIFYVAIGLGLVNGLRSAWTRRIMAES